MIKILVTLFDALSFEDQVGAWLTLEKTFKRSVDALNNATTEEIPRFHPVSPDYPHLVLAK
jgi:hypothetical protein